MSNSQHKDRLVDLTQLQMPGLEGLWREAVLITEEMADRLLAALRQNQTEELIPQEILINPHQLALEVEERQLNDPD